MGFFFSVTRTKVKLRVGAEGRRVQLTRLRVTEARPQSIVNDGRSAGVIFPPSSAPLAVCLQPKHDFPIRPHGAVS